MRIETNQSKLIKLLIGTKKWKPNQLKYLEVLKLIAETEHLERIIIKTTGPTSEAYAEKIVEEIKEVIK